jgi:hypothetical protein
MANTHPNCPGSSSHTHGVCPQALGSHTRFDHQFATDKPNYGSGGCLEKHAVAPRNEQ